MKTFYITTPLYYVNAKLHIGHSYTTIAADVIARFKRMTGYDVFFLTGSDEHGQKIEESAKKIGITPQERADQSVENFKEIWKLFNITYTKFIRTTNDYHEKTVLGLFTKLLEKGDIYKGIYKGLYCVPCESFWSDSKLKDGKCPSCGREVETLEEENYFFKISQYIDTLLKHIDDHPDFIQPENRKNQVLSILNEGIQDRSVSRSSVEWGISVPNDPEHVIWVWFDALINYISGIGYPNDSDMFKKYWPADIHFIAKDILWFHSILWPMMLLAADIELPKKVFAHGFWSFRGDKMSKSKGNVIDPIELANEYSSDAIRYFLLAEIPFGKDGDFYLETFIKRLNSDLANDFGNLLNRTLTMVEKYFDSLIPEPGENEDLENQITELRNMVFQKYNENFEILKYSAILRNIWKLVQRLNKYIDETLPFQLAKDESKRPKLRTVLYNLCENLRIISVLIYPFMPDTYRRIQGQLGLTPQDIPELSSEIEWGGLKPGTKLGKREVLFQRIKED